MKLWVRFKVLLHYNFCIVLSNVKPKEEDSDTEGSDDEVIYGKFKE